MNIVLLGGSGFVGSWVAKALLDQGFAIIAVVRAHTHNRWRMDWLATQYDGLSVIALESFTSTELTLSLQHRQPMDALINCAGDGINPQRQSVPDLWAANVDLNCEAAEAAFHLHIPRLIVAGSGFEYGFSQTFRQFGEHDPLRPSTLYAATKIAGFHAVKERCRKNRISLDYLRLFGVVGPGDNTHRLLPSAIRALSRGESLTLTDGHQVRDFVAAADVARAFVMVLLWKTPHDVEVFNVASGHGTSIRDLVWSVCRQIGTSDTLLRWGELPSRESEALYWVGDIDKIRRLVGWAPQVGLEALIRESYEFYIRQSVID